VRAALRAAGINEQEPREKYQEAQAEGEGDKLLAPTDVQRSRPGKAGEKGLSLAPIVCGFRRAFSGLWRLRRTVGI
jgi:hypothetical protein